VDRIAIVGCGGSGKSRRARILGAALGIGPVHLDGLYYDRDWKPLDEEEFAALQGDLVAEPQWIIDGNYASSLPIRLAATDTVIFLDLPARACLWGIIQRWLWHGSGQHDAIGVYDRITWNFIGYIAGYRKKMAPRVRHSSRTRRGRPGSGATQPPSLVRPHVVTPNTGNARRLRRSCGQGPQHETAGVKQ
jgi:adenylate kinase family enzyme